MIENRKQERKREREKEREREIYIYIYIERRLESLEMHCRQSFKT